MPRKTSDDIFSHLATIQKCDRWTDIGRQQVGLLCLRTASRGKMWCWQNCTTTVYLTLPLRGLPCNIVTVDLLGGQKTRMMPVRSYRTVKKVWRYDHSFRRCTNIGQRRTDGFASTISRDKKEHQTLDLRPTYWPCQCILQVTQLNLQLCMGGGKSSIRFFALNRCYRSYTTLPSPTSPAKFLHEWSGRHLWMWH